LRKQLCVAAAALVAAGCNLVDSHGVHVGYSFDPQHFTENLGDPTTAQTVPQVACTSGASPDQCTQAATTANIPMTQAQVTCQSGTCGATAAVLLPQKIDLRNAMTSLPSEAVQFGIDSVTIDKIEYWVASNTLNLATPPVDLWVAPDTAKDINDPAAVKLGTVAPLPAKSSTCADPMDTQGDTAAMGHAVCDVPLTDAGTMALQQYIKNYMKAPFQIFVHATLTAPGGSPMPAGMLDLYVRPSVTLSILK
jgi:hypothetical protein